MARPSAQVKHSQEVGDGSTWEILDAEAIYVIVYKNEPAAIRITKHSLTGTHFIYKKLTYTNLSSARLQVKRLNHRFKCNDFEVLEVC